MRFRNRSRALKLNGKSYDTKIAKKNSLELAIKMMKSAIISANTLSQFALIRSMANYDVNDKKIAMIEATINAATAIKEVFQHQD
jgi:hypothetical protein